MERCLTVRQRHSKPRGKRFDKYVEEGRVGEGWREMRRGEVCVCFSFVKDSEVRLFFLFTSKLGP